MWEDHRCTTYRRRAMSPLLDVRDRNRPNLGRSCIQWARTGDSSQSPSLPCSRQAPHANPSQPKMNAMPPSGVIMPSTRLPVSTIT